MALPKFPMRVAAAALLALGSTGAAYAQLDHSVYGVLDLSYGRFEPSGDYRSHRFNSNSMTATFVGAAVSYGLEGGWTPGITLEAFYRLQDAQGGRNDNDPLLSRNAFVSLQHRDHGTLRAGRLQTLLFNTTTRFNALGNSVAFSPAVRHIFGAGNLNGVDGDFYWNNGVSYATPRFDGVLEGLSAQVMHAQGEAQRKGDLSAATLIVSRGLFAASLSVQRVDVDDGIADPTDENAWQLGASYNLGLAQLFGQITETDDRGLLVRSRIVSAGISLPVGPGSVLLQAAHTRADGLAVDRRQTSVSAAYQWAFDSVTDVYVVGMDDRVRGQTRGVSLAVGVRYRF